MSLLYKVSINNPEQHLVEVKLCAQRPKGKRQLMLFLPSWSPGSYLMREYARHIRQMRVVSSNGEYIYFTQSSKNSWTIDWDKSSLKQDSDKFTVEYEVYCHELTVRTSHITREHAYLHGPTYLIGIEEDSMKEPKIEISFPPLWSKISTGLKDISEDRQHFIYQAKDYDELLDCPIEVGCHETDGFMVNGIPHELAFFGRTFPVRSNLKEDIKTIVEHISGVMKDIPYERYLFLAHFAPHLYGGLEHRNSTALHFDSMKLSSRKDYVNWLALVSHEYFHTWNVKRIRPKGLGPFDYRNEAYTKLLWLAEGLTSLMDELFIYQCGLITLEEYLELQIKNLNRYLGTAGRRFHSLEDSSFNAWIKLYRPDENSSNSTVSYYLKGGIVFWALNALMAKEGMHIRQLLDKLWERYKADPTEGMESAELFAMIRDLTGDEIADKFESMVQTTEELDLERIFADVGLNIIYEKASGAYLGITTENRGDRVFVKSAELDGAAYKAGLNAGDEILAINGLRVVAADFAKISETLLTDVAYLFTVSRLGHLMEVELITQSAPKRVKSIEVADLAKVDDCLKG